VGGQPASQSVPKGTKGTIVSFTDEKTKAEFANASWLFKPEQLEKAIEDGVVSQASAVWQGIHCYSHSTSAAVEVVSALNMAE
jgi:hypothetical protein